MAGLTGVERKVVDMIQSVTGIVKTAAGLEATEQVRVVDALCTANREGVSAAWQAGGMTAKVGEFVLEKLLKSIIDHRELKVRPQAKADFLVRTQWRSSLRRCLSFYKAEVQKLSVKGKSGADVFKFGTTSRRRDCPSAAPPSTSSRCFNRDGEGVSAQ